MKKLFALLSALSLAFVLSMPALAQTAKPAKKASTAAHFYYGDISDSMCGAKHMMPGSARDCTLKCVKNGAKYAIVIRGKVVPIANQDFAELEKYAGEHVKVTGTRKAGSITIASITPVKARAKRSTTAKAKTAKKS